MVNGGPGFLAIVTLAAALTCGVLRAEPSGVIAPDPDFSAQQVTAILFKAKSGERPDFAKRFLTYLDLAELDFKGALLSGADLYGSDFTGANLAGADLSKTRMDRTVLIRANLSDSNLTDASILRPTIYSNDQDILTDAPSFNGANLTRVHVQANLSGADFRGADMTEAFFSPHETRAGAGTLSTLFSNVLKSCNFTGAHLHGAQFARAILTFSRFNDADLTGVNFAEADLTKVDFTGADLTGADVTGADLYDANFTSAKGLDKIKGLAAAKNADKVVR